MSLAVYDNPGTQVREVWVDGRLAGSLSLCWLRVQPLAPDIALMVSRPFDPARYAGDLAALES